MHKRWFELGEEIAETAAMIDAATHRFLTMLREFDRGGGWFAVGALSCAHWLSWRVGMDLGAAREKVRVARALEGLPAIDEALEAGESSYSKVRARTRVGSEGARTEGDERRRYVTSRATDDGMVSSQVRLFPEEAARLMKAFESAAESGDLADGAVALADGRLGGGSGVAEVVLHVEA